MASIIRDPALDYRKLSAVKPTYRMSKLLQNTGGTGVTLSTSGTSESVFDLPSRCMNLSRSYLSFNIDLPAFEFSKAWTLGMACINRIELRTRGGTQIVDVNNADVFYKATSAYTTKFSDLMHADTPKLDASTAAERTTSYNSMVSRCNKERAAVSVAEDENPARIVAGVYASNSVSYTEPQYFAVSASGAASVVQVALPLSEFKGTFLSEKQDCYFDEVIQLRIQWSQVNKLGHTSDSGTTTGNTDPIASASISNLALYQALEVDSEICRDLVKKVRSGMSQTVPYVYTFREAHNATEFNRQIRINQSHGKNLLRVIHCNTVGAESDETNIDLDNSIDGSGDGSEVVSFYTSLDNLRLQEIDVRAGQHAEDYAFMKKQIEGSCVQDRSTFNHLRIWSDSFDGQRLCDTPDMDSVENGLPLAGVERIWALNQTNNGAASRVNYVFVVTQKTLQQASGQILML